MGFKSGNRRRFLAGATLIFLVAGWGIAAAQSQRTIRIIYPFAAGGTGDAMARIVAEKISADLSVPVIVENRTGAAGRIGAKAVISADPDGTTLLFAPSPLIAIYPTSYPALDYDPESDLAPITLVATFDVALVVGPQMEAKTVRELIDWVKANPAQANYGSPGAGGLGHFFTIMFTSSAGIDLRHVSYRGSAAVMTDLIGGQIPIGMVPLGDALELHKGGRVRILASSGAQRSPLLPDVPTFIESGAKVEGLGWYALYAPAKASAEFIAKVNKAVVDGLAPSDVKDRILKLSLVPKTSTPAELKTFQNAESKLWAPAVKASGFTPQQ